MSDKANVQLVSMADIARMAGQSRATVGNWKAREDDFPEEHSRGKRGPLYDRELIARWLAAKGRITATAPIGSQLFGQVDEEFARGFDPDVVLELWLVVLALRCLLPEASWSRIAGAEPAMLEDQVRSAAHQWLGDAADLLPRVALPVAGLEGVVRGVSALDQGGILDTADFVLDRLLQGHGHMGHGKFSTPRSLRSLMTELCGPGASFYDPAAGAGRLLIEVAEASNTFLPPALFGQEPNVHIRSICELNLKIHGLEATIKLDNVLFYDLFPDAQFDRVVCDPPWGQRLPETSALVDDPRWIWGEPTGDASTAWIQHCLYHLGPEGKAVIALPPKILFEKGRTARTLQGIIKAGLLEAVVSLPPGLLPGASIGCAVLVFAKGRPTVDGKPSPALMINIDDAQLEGVGRERSLAPGLIASIGEIYRNWTSGTSPNSEIASTAQYDDLAENAFDLSPRRYVVPSTVLVDTTALLHQQQELIRRLGDSLDTCKKTDAQLIRLLQEQS
ncbi:MAG TPA: N-6 DNA methylase [Acidimicrobiales bacterium]|jgi:hypothetical protein|nr:N-6 DNA methylase [Acidimicrobiales bacterium]